MNGQVRTIIHFHSTLGVYGAERWTLALLGHLDPTRFRAIVLTVGTKDGADTFSRAVHDAGFSARHIPVSGKINLELVRRVKSFCREVNADIFHTHGFKSDILGYLATRDLPTRLVTTVHGWSADEGIRIRLYEALGRVFLRGFDRIYPLSPGLLESLQSKGLPDSRLRMIRNAVDLAPFTYSFAERRSGDLFAILFAGRICRPKGVLDLAEAFARAKIGCPSKLTFAGDGPEAGELAQRVRQLGIDQRTELKGNVPLIHDLLATSNVLVLPSYSEGTPRVVMEAFASGIPVIGTSIPGIQQLVAHEDTGLLVPTGNPDALASCLARLANDPDLGRQLAENAYRKVTEEFSAERLAADFSYEYDQLCAYR